MTQHFSVALSLIVYNFLSAVVISSNKPILPFLATEYDYKKKKRRKKWYFQYVKCIFKERKKKKNPNRTHKLADSHTDSSRLSSYLFLTAPVLDCFITCLTLEMEHPRFLAL